MALATAAQCPAAVGAAIVAQLRDGCPSGQREMSRTELVWVSALWSAEPTPSARPAPASNAAMTTAAAHAASTILDRCARTRTARTPHLLRGRRTLNVA
jgi:hypothetical protein